MAARRTKLTPELIKALSGSLRIGASQKDACHAAGINPRTLQYWIVEAQELERQFDKADEELDTEIPISAGARDKDKLLLELLDAVRQAEGKARVTMIGIIQTAATTNWQAAAWYLERSDPERWGRRQKNELDVSGELTVRIVREKAKAPEQKPDNGGN